MLVGTPARGRIREMCWAGNGLLYHKKDKRTSWSAGLKQTPCNRTFLLLKRWAHRLLVMARFELRCSTVVFKRVPRLR